MIEAVQRLLLLNGGNLLVQWAGFAVAAALKTEVFFDLTGALTNVGLICYAAAKALNRQGVLTPRQAVNGFLVAIWAMRLGIFLFSRILKEHGRDSRFDKIRAAPVRFFIVWTIQAVWIAITALPVHTLLCTDQTDRKGADTVTNQDLLGWALWAIGFTMQVLADYQKTQFRANPVNKGKFIKSGIWALAQHPNYGGEIMMWSGLFVSCAAGFTHPLEYITALSPLFVFSLLRYVSGVPLLQRAALKRWGSDREWQRYFNETPLFVPMPRFLRQLLLGSAHR